MGRARGIYQSLDQLVGGTPLLDVTRLFPAAVGRVVAKLEAFGPGASVKDRAGLAIIRAAERDGRLTPGGVIVEASSGNTGIALAWVGAALGYRVIIAIPDDQSIERRQLLAALGAEVVTTPAAEGMAGANRVAGEILEATPGAFLAGQGGNPANPQIHQETTGPEIWRDTDGQVDVFAATAGTGGTLTGVALHLRALKPSVRIVGIEPAEAAVFNGGSWRPHKIQGIVGGDSAPPVLDLSLVDEWLDIPGDEAIAAARAAARQLGLLTGVSGGSALVAAGRLASRPENTGRLVVTVLPDSGERYLSTDLYT